jgi:secreted PhoX family phosphatase
MNEFFDGSVNPSTTQSLMRLRSPLRRRIILGTAVAALFPAAGLAARKSFAFSFDGVPLSASSDSIALPAGYRWSVVAAWGDPIDGQGKAMSPDADDTAAMQENQFGMHHDGGAFFPEKGSSNKGVWVVNHEYTDDGLLHAGGMASWTTEKVKKSQAAHGVTVCMIARQPSGEWRPVPSPLTRRITANTLCDVSGPASGHVLMRTA